MNNLSTFFNSISIFKKAFIVLVFITSILNAKGQSNSIAQFVFTSDSHYGISRNFRGAEKVSSQTVNQSMIAQMNTLPMQSFPTDEGVNAGKKVGSIDYLIVTGDIANRQQEGIQTAAVSWSQFTNDYLKTGVKLFNAKNQIAPKLLIAGNHDVSNAIGYPKPMDPKTDASAMVGIYNYMFNPMKPMTNSAFDFKKDKINYAIDVVGVHLEFISMWPDSANRVWMEKDLAKISLSTPVIIFTHDEVEVEAKHFTNPNGTHDINGVDKFENLLEEILKDGKSKKSPTIIEQQGFVDFLKMHPNIKAYFHGNTNSNEFYTYKGPNKDVDLKVFRVDSPMKGTISGLGDDSGPGDETKLSFQVIALDGASKILTVRECLWNTAGTSSPLVWGQSRSVSLK